MKKTVLILLFIFSLSLFADDENGHPSKRPCLDNVADAVGQLTNKPEDTFDPKTSPFYCHETLDDLSSTDDDAAVGITAFDKFKEYSDDLKDKILQMVRKSFVIKETVSLKEGEDIVMGDIHGNLYATILPLIVSGVVSFDEKNPVLIGIWKREKRFLLTI